jgi:hypothetical protein
MVTDEGGSISINFTTEIAEVAEASFFAPFDGFDPFGKLRAGWLTASGLRATKDRDEETVFFCALRVLRGESLVIGY